MWERDGRARRKSTKDTQDTRARQSSAAQIPRAYTSHHTHPKRVERALAGCGQPAAILHGHDLVLGAVHDGDGARYQRQLFVVSKYVKRPRIPDSAILKGFFFSI